MNAFYQPRMEGIGAGPTTFGQGQGVGGAPPPGNGGGFLPPGTGGGFPPPGTGGGFPPPGGMTGGGMPPNPMVTNTGGGTPWTPQMMANANGMAMALRGAPGGMGAPGGGGAVGL